MAAEGGVPDERVALTSVTLAPQSHSRNSFINLAKKELTVALEDIGGTSWWASILTTLGSQYGTTHLRFVGQVDGKTRYKSSTFPAARSVTPVSPQESWSPGMNAALAELKRDLARDGWKQVLGDQDPSSLRYER
ncbi:hypothetical protein [Arthrobacter flavus]|uniref:Uncharacterized protein n=1 Tax=Arthrobacter flavus TaxID=95172 RepID=A0ABW4QAU6_9MICC